MGNCSSDAAIVTSYKGKNKFSSEIIVETHSVDVEETESLRKPIEPEPTKGGNCRNLTSTLTDSSRHKNKRNKEQRQDGGHKWKFLEHMGVDFAPKYEPLPEYVNFFYDGKVIKLNTVAEEAATLYSKLVDEGCTLGEDVHKNFFQEWKQAMTPEEQIIIVDFEKCDFKEILLYFKQKREGKKEIKDGDKQMENYKDIVKNCWQEVDRQCLSYLPLSKCTNHSTGWRIARIFVSSTFTDFHNEREILVKKVFPELREWCEGKHINIIDCDLRWGIPQEATTGETISTCLEELDRCHEETDGKPFFSWNGW